MSQATRSRPVKPARKKVQAKFVLPVGLMIEIEHIAVDEQTLVCNVAERLILKGLEAERLGPARDDRADLT